MRWSMTCACTPRAKQDGTPLGKARLGVMLTAHPIQEDGSPVLAAEPLPGFLSNQAPFPTELYHSFNGDLKPRGYFFGSEDNHFFSPGMPRVRMYSLRANSNRPVCVPMIFDDWIIAFRSSTTRSRMSRWPCW
jgi:hypothetical protein